MWEVVYKVKGQKSEATVTNTPKGFLVELGGVRCTYYKKLDNAKKYADDLVRVK